jgi:hypothetical protein
MDFFADVLTTGTVLGVDAELGPDVATAVLGAGYAENDNGWSFWRDYGLVEIAWQRRPGGPDWEGMFFMLQTHRLTGKRPVVNDAIKAEYGGFRQFKRPLMLADLEAELDRRGVPLIARGEPDSGYQEYWVPDSEMSVLAVVDAEGQEKAWGTVEKIGSAFHRDLGLRARFKGQEKQIWQTMEYVVGLSPRARENWFEKHKPGTGVADWWAFHCLMIAAKANHGDDMPKRDQWARFAWWAFGHGQSTGLLSAEWTAIRTAEFLSGIAQGAPGITGGLPSGDELVRNCLDQLPSGRKLSTRTHKSLVDMAFIHRHRVEDPALVAELDGWREIRVTI